MLRARPDHDNAQVPDPVRAGRAGLTMTENPVDDRHLTIDGQEITVPKGTLMIRAAEQLGIIVPRFCDHPLLDPVGACRQCVVEVEGSPSR
jgi:NADH-quinone oxidoreductase subunit G